MKLSREHRLFHTSRGRGLRTLFFAALAVGLMAANHQFQALNAVRNVFSGVLYPIVWLVNAPTAGIRDLNSDLQTHNSLIAENIKLKHELLMADIRGERAASLEKQNRRLRSLLGAAASLPGHLRVASILSVNMTPYANLVEINAGRQAGLHARMPVLDANGLVGQIESCGPFSSKVMLITDPESAVPVEIQRTGLATLAYGTGSLNLLSLPYLPNNANVKPGDKLISSGLGGEYPRGYPVAVVTSVSPRPGRRFAQVEASPVAALGREHEVLIYTSPLHVSIPRKHG